VAVELGTPLELQILAAEAEQVVHMKLQQTLHKMVAQEL